MLPLVVVGASRDLDRRYPEAPVRVLVLNGPNLSRLGRREPEVYGRTTHEELAASLRAHGAALGLSVEVRQSDAEHELLSWLHEAADEGLPVVLNPAGWSHTSVALRDACAMLTAPLVEVHLSNIHAREEFRHRSLVSPVATGVVAGLGPGGYRAALSWIAEATGTASEGPGATDGAMGASPDGPAADE